MNEQPDGFEKVAAVLGGIAGVAGVVFVAIVVYLLIASGILGWFF